MPNFFDPRWTSDGKLYAPERYKEIVRERYLISKNSNISYEDTANITPTERAYLLLFIVDDLKRQSDIIENIQAKQQNNK